MLGLSERAFVVLASLALLLLISLIILISRRSSFHVGRRFSGDDDYHPTLLDAHFSHMHYEKITATDVVNGIVIIVLIFALIFSFSFLTSSDPDPEKALDRLQSEAKRSGYSNALSFICYHFSDDSSFLESAAQAAGYDDVLEYVLEHYGNFEVTP